MSNKQFISFRTDFYICFYLQRLTSWSLAEIVHAIVILTHFHSLSSFVFSCGLTQELDKTSSQKNSLQSSKIATPLLIEDTGKILKFVLSFQHK